MLFGGNLVRQPAFAELREERPNSMRIVSDLNESDKIMNDTIFLGTYPGLTQEMLEKEIKVIKDFANNK